VGVGELLNPKEEAVLVATIAEWEAKTSGEIVIHIAKKLSSKDGMKDAYFWFEKLGITKTKNRNGVLLFIAARDHFVAILGDVGIHSKVEPDFWNQKIHLLIEAFKSNDKLIGLCRTVESIGAVLAQHFPLESNESNPNELDNALSKSHEGH